MNHVLVLVTVSVFLNLIAPPSAGAEEPDSLQTEAIEALFTVTGLARYCGSGLNNTKIAADLSSVGLSYDDVRQRSGKFADYIRKASAKDESQWSKQVTNGIALRQTCSNLPDFYGRRTAGLPLIGTMWILPLRYQPPTNPLPEAVRPDDIPKAVFELIRRNCYFEWPDSNDYFDSCTNCRLGYYRKKRANERAFTPEHSVSPEP